MTLRIKYLGHVGTLSGFAYGAMDTLDALRAAGVEFDFLLNPDADPRGVPARYGWMRDCIEQKPTGWASHVFVHCVPAVAEGWAERVPEAWQVPTILLTTWETTKLPQEYVAPLNRFDAVIVPCTWNAEVLRDAGVGRVHVVPHNFQRDWWFAPRPPRPAAPQPFRFYSILTWSERKNALGLLKAFWVEFRDPAEHSKVLLSIVTPNYNEDEVGGVQRGLGLPAYAPVQYLGMAPNRLTDEAVRELHWAADCYVSAARGEGWGLGAFEAALVGNTVIAPNYGGFKDFLSYAARSYPVRCFDTPAVTPLTVSQTRIESAGLTLRPVLHNQPLGIRGDQHWAEPDLMQLRTFMRRAFERGAPPEASVAASRAELLARFGSEAVGKLLVSILEGL